MGLEQKCIGYLENYISVMERAVIGSFLLTIVLNKSIKNKKSAFERINEEIDELKELQKDVLEKAENNFQEINLPDVMEFFICLLERYSWYKKHKIIMKMLQEENEEILKNSKQIISLDETKKIILVNGKKMSESDRKLNDISELIRKARKSDNNYLDHNIDWTNVIIKPELFTE